MVCRVEFVESDRLSGGLGLSEEEARSIEKRVAAILLDTGSYLEALGKVVEEYGGDCPRLVFALVVFGQFYFQLVHFYGRVGSPGQAVN